MNSNDDNEAEGDLKKLDLWAGADVLSIGTPPPSDDLRYLKSSALNMWLFGYEFPATIMVFAKKQIHFLCTQKKASLLDVVKRSAKEAVGAEVTTHVKAKGDYGTSQMDAILKSLRGDNTAVGFLAKQAPEGKLLEAWDSKLKGSDLSLVDITNGLAYLFDAKDKDEILNIKKAAFLSAAVIKNLVVPKLEKIIDDEKKVSHSVLMDDTEKAVLAPSRVKIQFLQGHHRSKLDESMSAIYMNALLLKLPSLMSLEFRRKLKPMKKG